MSDPTTLSTADFELEDGPDTPLTGGASEQLRGVANRIIFSRYYILFYFVMMSLSLTTVVLSLIATSQHQCPPFAWNVLEVIINILMVAEVSTRWIAYGKKYPMTLLNIVDLLLVLFCIVTLLLVFVNPCGEGTHNEELLDTILLVIRNAVQFLRLGNILRRSGHSIFKPPKPMDLTQARAASIALEMDLDLDDEEAVAERTLTSGRVRGGLYQPIYADEPRTHSPSSSAPTAASNVVYNAGREELGEEDQEMWDRFH